MAILTIHFLWTKKYDIAFNSAKELNDEFVLQNILTGYLIFQKNCYYDYNNTKQLQFFV